jgi:ATP/maltotriose-dependent transcriptional regulator MalT
MARAGAFDAALRLLEMAEAGPLDELQRARAELLRGQIAFSSSRGNEAPPLLLKAAQSFERLDVGLARQTYLEALSAAQYAGRFATGGGTMREVAEAARAAPAASQPPGAPDLLLDGLALLNTQGYAAAGPTLERALSAFSSEDISTQEGLRWLWLVVPAAQIRWDDESWHLLSTRHVRLARDVGALGVFPMALSQRAALHLFEGDFAAAASLIEEAAAITEATGSRLPPYAPLGLAAFRGRDVEFSELVKVSTKEMVRRGEGVGLTFIHFVTAVLYNGLGRYQDALTAAQRAGEDPHEQLFSTWGAVELIEAAVRSGVPEQAAGTLERLSNSTGAGGSDWALGIQAAAQALLSDGEGAERLYREAIDRLARTRVRWSLARAHLLYGEWLRRRRRRTDAREHLRAAHKMFVTMGAEGFAERTRRELLATGETARKRTVETGSQLTAQETQVAELAREGLSNPEIGARLFISPRTVEYHLRKVFTKLGINSRMQLHRVLPIHPSVT